MESHADLQEKVEYLAVTREKMESLADLRENMNNFLQFCKKRWIISCSSARKDEISLSSAGKD